VQILTRVLRVLSKSKEGREQMERFCGCVQILTRVFRNGSSRGVQYVCFHDSGICAIEIFKNSRFFFMFSLFFFCC